ncbi:MAG TPA: hypothetical protein VFK40_03160 [Nitrososphaeraceae archaeon]|nr:hypothetical protein [Nitrososphaeraceae archaeon]
MFPIKRLERMHEELNHYYSQVITYPKADPNYLYIANELSKNLSELDSIIKDIRKYNYDNKRNPLIHIINK